MVKVSVFSDTICTLGEGPAAHPELERLFWFDILGKRLLEKPFSGSGTRVHDLPFNGSVMAVVDRDRQLIVGHDGLWLRDVRSGKLNLVKAIEEGPGIGTNDGRVHPSGALWFSTMGRGAETGAGSIRWFFKGEIREIFPSVSIPNAISFLPDGSAAYFADTARHTIFRVETDPATGLPTEEPSLFLAEEGEGGPDGAVVDDEGIFWNARWGIGRLDAYAPDGKRLKSIDIPARQATCPAFVGRNADRLVVTSAREGYDEKALAEDPLAGQTFLVDLPVKGRFDPPVALS